MSGKTTVMKPGAAIAACFGKFARCYGRSCRAEFIWFLLFFLVLGALAVWFTSPMIVGMLWALLMIPLSTMPGCSSPVPCCFSSASPAVRKAPTSTVRRRA